MENISVHVRVRPLNSLESGDVCAWEIGDTSIRQNYVQPGIRDSSNVVYTLDTVFGPLATTREIYEKTAQPLLHHVLDGINGTILAYGQTSSGKTFTMIGTKENPGLIPMAMEEIFQLMSTRRDRCWCVTVSYMEVYSEKVNDLLAPANTNLEVKEHKEKGVYVSGLAALPVDSAATVLQLLRQGEAGRHTSQTKMNEHSSRSHTVFRMDVESRQVDSDMPDPQDVGTTLKKSTLTLVDLAGSERVAKTGAEGVTMKEGTAINASLLSLGNVINKLGDAVSASHIPYRDSKLTRILQPSLGGNAKTVMICAMTPANRHIEESHSTLRFATRAKCVVNHAKVNEIIPTEVQLRRAERTIQELQGQLQALTEQKDAGVAVNIEEQIKSLMEMLNRSEEDKKEILATLEQEKLEREKAQLQAEIAKKLLEHQGNNNESVSRRRPSRRETWCPGDYWPKSGADIESFHTTMGRKRHIQSLAEDDPDDPSDIFERVSQRARSMSEGMDSPPGSPRDGEVSSGQLPRKVKNLEEELLEYKERLAAETKARQELEVTNQIQQSEVAKLASELRLRTTELDGVRQLLEVTREEHALKSGFNTPVVKQGADKDKDGELFFTFAQPATFSTKLQAALERATEAEQRAATAELQCEQLKVSLADTETKLAEIEAEKAAVLEQAAQSLAEVQAKHKEHLQNMLEEQQSQQEQHRAEVEQLQAEVAALHTELANNAAAGGAQTDEEMQDEPPSLKAQQGDRQVADGTAHAAAADSGDDTLELLRAQLERAKQREKELEAKLEDMSKQLQTSEGEVRLLVRAKSELEAEARQLRSGTDPYKNRMVDVNTFAASRDKEDVKDVRKYRQENASLKAELQKLQVESKNFTTNKAALQKDLDMTRKKLSETEAKLKQAVQERSEAVQEKAYLERKLKLSSQKALTQEKNHDRKDSVMDKKRDIKASEGLKSKAQVDAIEGQLHHTMSDLRVTQDELKTKTGEFVEAQARIQELENSNKDLQDVQNRLDKELADTRELLSAAATQQQKLEEAAAAAAAKVSQLEQQCQDLQEQLQKASSNCEDLQEKYSIANEHLQKEEAAIVALEEAKQEMSALIVTLNQQLENAKEQVVVLEKGKMAAEKEVQRLSGELQAAIESRSSPEAKLEARTVGDAKTEELQTKLQEAQRKLAELQSSHQQAVDAAQDKEEEMQAMIEDLQHQVQECQAIIDAINAEVESLRKRLEARKADLEGAYNTNKQLTGQLEQQVRQREAAEKELDELKLQINRQREAASRSSTPSKTPPRSTGKSRSLSGLDLLTVDHLQQELQKQKELTNKLAEEKAVEVQTLQTELNDMCMALGIGQAQIHELQSELQECKALLAQAGNPTAHITAAPVQAALHKDTAARASLSHEASPQVIGARRAGLAGMMVDAVAQPSPAASPAAAQRMAAAAADYSAAVMKSRQLEEQLQEVTKEKSVLQEKLAKAGQAAAEHDVQLQALREQVKNHPKVAELQQEVDRLNGELKNKANEKESLVQQLEVLQKQSSSLADKASKEQVFYAAEMMRVKAELDTVCAERTDLQRQVNRLQEELTQVAEMAEDDAAKYKVEVEGLNRQLAEAKDKTYNLQKKLDEELEMNTMPANVFANMEATVQQLLFAASPHSTTQSIDMIRSMAMSDFLASVEMQGEQPRSARRSSAGSDSFKDMISSEAGSPLGTKPPALAELPPSAADNSKPVEQSARRQSMLPTLHEVPETSLTTPLPNANRPAPINPADVPMLDVCMSPCDSEAGMKRTQVTAYRVHVQQLAAALRAKVVENADLQQQKADLQQDLLRLQAKVPVADAETNTVETNTAGRSCLPNITRNRGGGGSSPPRTPRDRSKSPRGRGQSPARSSPYQQTGTQVAGATSEDGVSDAKRVVELEHKLAQQSDVLHGYLNEKAALQLENQQLVEQVCQLQQKMQEVNDHLAVQQQQCLHAAESQAMLAVAQSDIEALRTEVDRLQSLNNGLQQQVDQLRAKLPAKPNAEDDWDIMDEGTTDFKAVIHSQEAMICNLRRQLSVANGEVQRLLQQYESKPSSKPSPPSLVRSSPRSMLGSPLKSRNSSPATLANRTASPEPGFRLPRFSSPLRRPSRENSPARLHIKSPASPRLLQQLGPLAMNIAPRKSDAYMGDGAKDDAKEVMALQAPSSLMDAELPAAHRMVAQVVNEPGCQVGSTPPHSGVSTDAAQVGRMVQEIHDLKAEVAKLYGELQEKSARLAEMQTGLQDTVLIKNVVQQKLEHAELECKQLHKALEEEQAKLQQEAARLQDELDREVSRRLHEVQDKEAGRAELQRQNKDLVEAKDAMTKRIHDLKTELNTMLQTSVAKCEKYQAQVEQLEAERDKAVEELRALNVSNAELKRKLEATEGHVSTHINACKAMEAQHAVYTSQLAELEQQLLKSKDIISDQKDTLRVQQVDIQGYEQEIKHLQEELDKKDLQLKKDIDTYEQQLEDLQDKLASKEATIQELQKSLVQAQEQQEKLESDAQLMQSRHFSESQRMQEQSENLKLEHAEAKRQLDALKASLEEQQGRVASLSETHGKAIAERKELEEQLKHALKELAAANEKAEACEKEKIAVGKQLSAVQQELSAVYKAQHLEQSQHLVIQQKCDELQKQIDSITEEKYVLEVKVKEQERLKRFCIDTADYSALNQQLQAHKARVSELEAAESQWTQREDMLARQLRQAQEATKNMDSKWQSTVAECERLEMELHNVQDDCRAKIHQLNRLAREKEETEAELAAVRKMLQQRTNERDLGSRQELIMLQNQNQKMRRDLQAGCEQVDELQEQNRQLVQQKNHAAAALQDSEAEVKHLRERIVALEQDSRHQQAGLVGIDELAESQKREHELQQRVKQLETRVTALKYEVQNLPPDTEVLSNDRLATYTRDHLAKRYIQAKMDLEKVMSVQKRMKEKFEASGYDIRNFEDLEDMFSLQYERDCHYTLYKNYQNAYKQTEEKRHELERRFYLLKEQNRALKQASNVKSNVVWADRGDDTMHSAVRSDRGRSERGRADQQHRERSKSRERERAVSTERERVGSRDRERARSATRSPAYTRPGR